MNFKVSTNDYAYNNQPREARYDTETPIEVWEDISISFDDAGSN